MKPIGIVSDLIKGGNDLLEIAQQRKKLMIPFVKNSPKYKWEKGGY